MSCGQWSVVGGQTDVPVTDKASNGGDVALWLSSSKSFVITGVTQCKIFYRKVAKGAKKNSGSAVQNGDRVTPITN